MRNFWGLLKLVFRLSIANSRRKTFTAVILMLISELALPLMALSLRFFINAVIAGNEATAAVASVCVVLTWMAQLTFWHFAYRFYFDLLDLNTISYDQEIIHLMNGSPAIEHIERADFANKLEVLRNETRELYWSFSLVVTGLGLALQLVLTAAILAWLAPALLAVPVFAVPALQAGRWAQRIIDRRSEQSAEPRRLGRHFLDLFASAGAAKEIRGFGLQRYLPRRADGLWSEVNGEQRRADTRATAVQIAGQAVFGLGYLGALLLLVSRAISGRASIGDVLLVVALTGQINNQLSRAMGQIIALHRLSRTVGRFLWLRGEVAPATARRGGVRHAPPARLAEGIEFRNVGFTYPGATSPVLSGIDLMLPAASIIGLVGENGSGKSTLLKLLAGFYQPTEGTITVDGADLSDIDPVEWRSRLSAAFQDYQRFELVARESVGIGDLSRVDEEPVVASALARASDQRLASTLPAGLNTHLGKSYTDGHDLSGGQWQAVALARSMMRDNPLLLILDEPTASLDAHAEYVLFERYAQQARTAAHRNGGVCILVSHRFSTVSMADQIVVVDKGEIAEIGSHDALISRDGIYASLYRMQAAGYH